MVEPLFYIPITQPPVLSAQGLFGKVYNSPPPARPLGWGVGPGAWQQSVLSPHCTFPQVSTSSWRGSKTSLPMHSARSHSALGTRMSPYASSGARQWYVPMLIPLRATRGRCEPPPPPSVMLSGGMVTLLGTTARNAVSPETYCPLSLMFGNIHGSQLLEPGIPRAVHCMLS